MKNLITLEGKPIKLIKMKYGKNYTMMRITKTNCVAVRIPRQCASEFIRPNGAEVRHGVVLVLPAKDVKQDGAYIDMSNAKEVREELFRKLFSVTKLSSGISERLKLAVKGSRANISDKSLSAESVDMGAKIEKATAIGNVNVSVSNQPGEQKVIEKPVDNRARVAASFVDASGKCVAYRIVAHNGMSRAYSIAEVAQLAKAGRLANVKFVSSERGDYIAGVGCSLKELPVEPL